MDRQSQKHWRCERGYTYNYGYGYWPYAGRLRDLYHVQDSPKSESTGATRPWTMLAFLLVVTLRTGKAPLRRVLTGVGTFSLMSTRRGTKILDSDVGSLVCILVLRLRE